MYTVPSLTRAHIVNIQLSELSHREHTRWKQHPDYKVKRTFTLRALCYLWSLPPCSGSPYSDIQYHRLVLPVFEFYIKVQYILSDLILSYSCTV